MDFENQALNTVFSVDGSILISAGGSKYGVIAPYGCDMLSPRIPVYVM